MRYGHNEKQTQIEMRHAGAEARPTRNNRIVEVDLLNQCCASEVDVESILLGEACKIFFQQDLRLAPADPRGVGEDCRRPTAASGVESRNARRNHPAKRSYRTAC